MAILSLSLHAGPRRVPPPAAFELQSCHFERKLQRGAMMEGGLLTCAWADGRERCLDVAMTWDVLAQLRAELLRHGVSQPDDLIIRCVLRDWGTEELRERLRNGICLPAQGLLLSSMGGPCSSEPRRLLEACGLLAPPAA